MRLLGVGRASTASGNFLVTKAKATHLDIGKLAAPVFECLPDNVREPDWAVLQWSNTLPMYSRGGLETRCEKLENELADARRLLAAHQAISQGQNAQLIVQNMAMGKLKQSLFEKEKGKKSDRTVLFPGGKGRHLTSDEVIAQKRAMENAKAKEVTDKEAKKVKRDEKKAEKERLATEWKAMLAVHGANVEKWEAQCLRLKAAGTRTKDLPKKPKRPLKPKPKESDTEDDESSEESEGDVA
ncbi:hypothetical protein DFH09DRAFT_1250689 [Mycena vulgaris]|nr:hypothetical protein DFH09DRAFT_1250689 [Mycena vulgaris]